MNREELLCYLVDTLSDWPAHYLNGVLGADTNWFFSGSAYHHSNDGSITIDDWNRAKIKPSTKIRIESPEHIEYVQKLAFEAGFEWRDGRCVRKPYGIKWLFFYDGLISLSGAEETGLRVKYKEIHIEMPKSTPPETLNSRSVTTDISAKVLAEKVGSSFSAKIYDDLRDAHHDLVNENMQLQKELEAAQQRIKNLHRAINDAKSALDE